MGRETPGAIFFGWIPLTKVSVGLLAAGGRWQHWWYLVRFQKLTTLLRLKKAFIFRCLDLIICPCQSIRARALTLRLPLSWR